MCNHKLLLDASSTQVITSVSHSVILQNILFYIAIKNLKCKDVQHTFIVLVNNEDIMPLGYYDLPMEDLCLVDLRL